MAYKGERIRPRNLFPAGFLSRRTRLSHLGFTVRLPTRTSFVIRYRSRKIATISLPAQNIHSHKALAHTWATALQYTEGIEQKLTTWRLACREAEHKHFKESGCLVRGRDLLPRCPSGHICVTTERKAPPRCESTECQWPSYLLVPIPELDDL